ncbi:hypothetical protein ABET51_10720 [Metabacillus fastidiosus]|uniref:hypothetical protein n=1 Tax=Metabacillus fastidiosus TaxID=1458 RepID=UPI002E22759E|nr:hypothetical protein [Metabacillus fastidiosus]
MKKYGSYFFIFTAFIIVLTGCNWKKNSQENLHTKQEVTEGDFIYRLISEKGEYAENRPVKLYAELEYIGDKEKVEIFHAASPFSFPMLEKTRGYEINYNMDVPLLSTTLVKSEPLRKEYSRSGGYGSEDEEDYVDFMNHIMNNEFPTGHYIVNGSANFFLVTNEETKEEKKYNMKAQIEFKVKDKKE